MKKLSLLSSAMLTALLISCGENTSTGPVPSDKTQSQDSATGLKSSPSSLFVGAWKLSYSNSPLPSTVVRTDDGKWTQYRGGVAILSGDSTVEGDRHTSTDEDGNVYNWTILSLDSTSHVIRGDSGDPPVIVTARRISENDLIAESLAEGESVEDGEANVQAIAVFEDTWCLDPDTGFYFTESERRPFYIQAKGISMTLTSDSLTEADRLNGIQWSGTSVFSCEAYREYIKTKTSFKPGYPVGWLKWNPSTTIMRIHLEKLNDTWTSKTLAVVGLQSHHDTWKAPDLNQLPEL